MPRWKPDPTFYASPTLAAEAPEGAGRRARSPLAPGQAS